MNEIRFHLLNCVPSNEKDSRDKKKGEEEEDEVLVNWIKMLR